jgi:hypothetical protein
VRHQVYFGHDETALEAARPILQGGMRCATVPHGTLGLVLLPLVRLGRAAEAVPLHQRGYRLISRNPKFLTEAGEHLTFLALTDNLPQAIRLLERHLSWALATADLRARFEFYNAVRFLLERLVAADKESVRLRLPHEFPAWREDGRYDVAELRAWFNLAAAELAARFDERNGNTAFTRELREMRRLNKLVTECPLRAPPA